MSSHKTHYHVELLASDIELKPVVTKNRDLARAFYKDYTAKLQRDHKLVTNFNGASATRFTTGELLSFYTCNNVDCKEST